MKGHCPRWHHSQFVLETCLCAAFAHMSKFDCHRVSESLSAGSYILLWTWEETFGRLECKHFEPVVVAADITFPGCFDVLDKFA